MGFRVASSFVVFVAFVLAQDPTEHVALVRTDRASRCGLAVFPARTGGLNSDLLQEVLRNNRFCVINLNLGLPKSITPVVSLLF